MSLAGDLDLPGDFSPRGPFQWSGRFFSRLLPSPRGPRQAGQFSASANPPGQSTDRTINNAATRTDRIFMGSLIDVCDAPNLGVDADPCQELGAKRRKFVDQPIPVGYDSERFLPSRIPPTSSRTLAMKFSPALRPQLFLAPVALTLILGFSSAVRAAASRRASLTSCYRSLSIRARGNSPSPASARNSRSLPAAALPGATAQPGWCRPGCSRRSR